MKYLRVLPAILLACSLSSSQTIDITVGNLQSQGAVLSSLSGEKLSRIDSIRGVGGRFSFSGKLKLTHAGMYRLTFDGGRWVDFLFDGADVRLTTDASNILESLRVEASEGNRLYYEFVRLNKAYKAKSELLQLVLARYPTDDPYYETTRSRLAQIQREYEEFVDGASRQNATSFIVRYIRSARLPIIDGNLAPERQLEYLKSHALNQVDFTDDGLIHSDLFTDKSIEYLTYYRNPQLPKELLEKEFNRAVDTILGKARVNQIVYQHITEYLLEGFKNFGFEKCIDYILENYVIKDDLCLDQSSGSTIQRMIDQKKLLTPGATVPNIILPDTSGKMVDLRQLKADNILLVFYSSACPHCRTMMPELQKLYASQQAKSVEVAAISLDTERGAWTKFIRDHSLTWISVSDLLGWGGQSASGYYIYATPTLVVLDKQGRVVGVPMTVEDARKYF